MVSKVYAMTINGLNPSVIDVEIDINNGLPAFTIVWLPDTSVQESKERLSQLWNQAKQDYQQIESL